MQNSIALPVTGTVSGLENNQKANQALETIATCFLGPDAPNPSYAGQWWVDTGTTIDASGGPWVRQRNSANSAWLRRFRCDLDFVNSLGSVQLPAGAGIVFEGATDDAYETTLVAAEPTADRTVTIPNESMTLAGRDVAQTFSAKQTIAATLKIQQVLEKETITASAPTGTFDCLTQAIQYFTSNASANWTQNFRGDGSNTLNSVMAIGESITVTIKATQGVTPYYPNAHQIDGSAVTPKWLGGAALASGDANSINVYSYTITKTADATFTVLASKSKYA